MMAVAVQNNSATYRLIDRVEEFVLSVPGERLVQEAMACGTTSLLEADKVQRLGLQLIPGNTVAVPGLANAIANIELVKYAQVQTGDHKLLVGRVVDFRVNEELDELPLVSFGPDTAGFKLLLKKGIHRLGTVAPD